MWSWTRVLPGVLVSCLSGCGASRADGDGDPSGQAAQGGGAGMGAQGGSAGFAGGAGKGGSSGSSGGGGPTCERPVTFSTVVVERPEPFDVIIVADHSGSIGWSRDSLSNGLKSLLSSIHGQEARFFVLTPTQYDITSEPAKTVGYVPLVIYRDPVTDIPYEHAVTEYVETCSAGGTPIDCALRREYQGRGVDYRGVWEFRLPEPIAAIAPEMDEAAIAVEQAKIEDHVLSLGVAGAQREQPICTLSRYVAQAPELLPENAVFLVISDEDDKSTPDECLASYSWIEEYQGDGNTPCETACELYRFEATYWKAITSVHYTCVPVDDNGVRHPENAFSGSTTGGNNPTCTRGTTSDCDEYSLGVAATSCGDNHVAAECHVECTGGSGYTCRLERANDGLDLCTTSFVEGGVTYQNFPEYCAATRGDSPFTDCKSQGYTRGGTPVYSGNETITKLVDVETLAEMVPAFKARADAVFGADSYVVETIQHDPSFACELATGQDYGVTLRTLASTNDDVFPLCEDYGPALERVRGFARTLIQSEFPFALAEDEELGGVLVTDHDGNQRELATTDYGYDPVSGVLRIAPDVLTPQDEELELSVLHECEIR